MTAVASAKKSGSALTTVAEEINRGYRDTPEQPAEFTSISFPFQLSAVFR
jgi:hypothetical protein